MFLCVYFALFACFAVFDFIHRRERKGEDKFMQCFPQTKVFYASIPLFPHAQETERLGKGHGI
jgi:hypothetical protein